MKNNLVAKLVVKLVVVSWLLLLVLFVLGCSQSGLQNPSYNFKQGIAELNFKLLPNTPPQKIYQNSNFKMILELDNAMAYDISNLNVKVVGLDDKYFVLNVYEQAIPVLIGKSLGSPSGDKQFLEFEGVANSLFENAKYYNANYFFKGSYNSKIDFSDSVCVNPNLYATYDAGCKVQDKKSYGGQGGALAVVGLEEIIYPAGTGGEVEFRINVANRGRGKVGSVTLGKSFFGGVELECKFVGDNAITSKVLKMSEEKQDGMLICKTFLRDQNSYTTSLSMDFSYDYEFKQQFSLNMVR